MEKVLLTVMIGQSMRRRV